jgi:very-short-patch-repair endonuclease
MPRPHRPADDPDAELLRGLFHRQAGLARRSQLLELGVTRQHVRARVRAGAWQVVAPEVISLDNGRLDTEQLRWRAVLHSPDAAWLSHGTGLAVCGLLGWEDGRVHLLTGRRQRPLRLSGVCVHQSDRLPGTVTDLSQGLPVVHGARATLDVAAAQPHPRLAAAAVIAALRQRICSPAELDAELAVCGRVRNKVAIREALRHAAGGAESVAEVDILTLIQRAGLPAPRRQVRIAGRRRDLVIDLPDGRILVLEVDGPQHDDPRARWVDARRDAELVALGYVVLRFPAYVLRTDPAGIVAQLRSIRVESERRAAASPSTRDQRS